MNPQLLSFNSTSIQLILATWVSEDLQKIFQLF